MRCRQSGRLKEDYSIHSKYAWQVLSDDRNTWQTGQYEDKAIDYETPMRILRENGYEGYIDSEYEGQRDQQDMGYENLPMKWKKFAAIMKCLNV